MTLPQLTSRALHVRKLYDQQARARNAPPWTAAQLAQGFTGDLGVLTKLILAREGLRPGKATDPDAALAHELADCLWSVLVIADAYGVNLEVAFKKTMTELELKLTTPRRTKTARKSRAQRD